MSFAGRMSKMKTRDLVARLNELRCVYIGQEGSHCKYKTPCGQSITFRCIKMNEELSLNVYSSVRRVLRAEGLDIDGSGYQQATCGDFVGAHRHVAGLAGTRGEPVDAQAVTAAFVEALGEFGLILLDFASPTSGPRGLMPAANVNGAVLVGIRDDLVVGAEGKAAVKRLAKLIGKPVEVPSLTVWGEEDVQGGPMWAMQNGVVYVWVLPMEAAMQAVSALESTPEPLAVKLAARVYSAARTANNPDWFPASWMGQGLDGLSGDVIPFNRRLTKEQSEKRFVKDRSEWYAAVTTHGSPVWTIIGQDRLAAVITVPATVRKDGRLSDYLTVRLEHGELHSVPTPMVAVRQTTEGRVLQFPKLTGLPSGWVTPPGLAGLGSDDADYYGEARMALDEEARYVQERWATMTPAEHRAEAKGARQMAEAMARSAMRAADGKTARYLQDRVVFYNKQAAEHERAALRKQRADEA